MSTTFLQLVVTIWIGAHGHPVRHELPRIYRNDGTCERAGVNLAKRWRPPVARASFEIECVSTDRRAA